MEEASLPRGDHADSGDCSFCNGTGVARGNAGDIDFEFRCVCKGGKEDSVRWLLGHPPFGHAPGWQIGLN
jgi:hypothetical protein